MRIGSLFSGYGGLDAAVQSVVGGTVAWVSDIDPGPAKILAHHWPDVPNLRDITEVDFTAVEPVDVLTGGFPCQDVSHAGRRQGLIRDGDGRTRSGLWGEMLRAINEQRPRMVVAENVRGLLSAQADSDVEPCPWCLGDPRHGGPMRALGAVLADLADIGYDAAWTGLRAADVGAAHGRFRVFILAWPATDTSDRIHGIDSRGVAGATPSRERVDPGAGRGFADRGGGDPAPLTLLPTPVSDNSRGLPQRGTDYASLPNAVMALLPTPTAQAAKHSADDRGPGTLDDHNLWSVAARLLPTPRAEERMQHNSRDAGMALSSAVNRLLPTPLVGSTSPASHGQISGDYRTRMAEALASWGDYAPAIARWEHALGRPAPAPTEPTGRDGAHRLSSKFVEWLMGLPEGHVTGVPGLTRNQQLKALGNGVVPQQAAAALTHLLAMEVAA